MAKGIRDIAWKAFVLAALAAPPAFFYFTVLRFAVNVPHHDDYDSILTFMLSYQDADGPAAKIRLIFAQNFEHRIALVYVASLAIYKLTGAIDFSAMIYFGALGLSGLALALYLMLPGMERKPLYFIPVILLIFQMQFTETVFWAMASISNFYVLFFSFSSLLLLNREGRHYLAGAFFLAALSSVTQGSGVFTFAVCAVLLAFKRDFRGLAVWLALSAVVLSLYFGFYEKPANHPSVIKAVFEAPVRSLEYFITFIGASFPFPFIAGLILISVFLLLSWMGYHRKNKAVYCALIFIFLTGIAAAMTRSGFGVEQALSSRYRIVSALFPILTYMALMEYSIGSRFWSRFSFPAILAGSLFFNINAYNSNIQSISDLNYLHKREMGRWVSGYPALVSHPDQAYAKSVLLQAVERGLYNPDFK